MRIARNVACVLALLLCVAFDGPVALARMQEACDIHCSWSGSCCSIGDLQCGGEGSGSGLCAYCEGGSGEVTSTECSAEGESGVICQCEGPLN